MSLFNAQTRRGKRANVLANLNNFYGIVYYGTDCPRPTQGFGFQLGEEKRSGGPAGRRLAAPLFRFCCAHPLPRVPLHFCLRVNTNKWGLQGRNLAFL